MSLFEHTNYKKWVRDWLHGQPRQGRGQLRRIAEYLNASPTIVSQVFNGDRELTPEQAVLLCEYMALSKLETKYFLTLVNHSRAGSVRYKKVLEEELQEIRAQSKEIKNRVQQNTVLSESAKAILYSNWYYLAVWSLTAIPGFDNLESLAMRLGIGKKKVREALDFLLLHGLVVEDEKNNFKVGPTLIHLESSSPQIPRHHQNWRLQAFNHYEKPRDGELFYSAPVTLSEKDTRRLKEKMLKFISESVDLIKDSPSEKLYCLCLDWFEI